jgi:hypothetical protein
MFFFHVLLSCSDPLQEPPSIDSPISQELQLLEQIEREPSTAYIHCKKFQTQPNRSYCQNIVQRPHLWERVKTTPFKERKGGGPNDIQIHLPNTSSKILQGMHPSDRSCPKDITKLQCRLQGAQEFTETKYIAGECNVLHSRSKDECYFLSAENMLRNHHNIPFAFDLCNESGSLWSSCIQHLITELVQHAPQANSPQIEWKRTLEIHEQIQEYWKQRHIGYSRVILDHFWEEVCSYSYSKIASPTGDMLDFLPEESKTHIRSHITYQIIKKHVQYKMTLDQWTDFILQHIHKRSQDTTPILLPSTLKPSQSKIPKRKLPPHFRKWNGIEKNWSHDSPSVEHFPAAYFLKDSRRATSSNERIDIQISILESLSRLNYQDDIFREGLHNSSQVVQFTAYRLMKK